ncbi:MAG: hypothetical protein ACFFF4_01855 [Candidatus Thorarchaeota archaeon]
MIHYRRIGIATILGAALGVLCIIGVGGRIDGGYNANMIYLLGIWYNRLIMGILIGFSGEWIILKSDRTKNIGNAVIRGLIFGILISLATTFNLVSISGTMGPDILGFFAGIAYGPIIDLVATYFEK